MKNEPIKIFSDYEQDNGILKDSGDKLEARVTPTGRQVIKIHLDNGNEKHSATKYLTTGTIVEHHVTKPPKQKKRKKSKEQKRDEKANQLPFRFNVPLEDE